METLLIMHTRTTNSGTPCSPAWDEAWIAAVEAAELSLGRRICGARTIAGNPCPLPQNHPNGRCKFHGGFNLTGAQPGNRNAVIHGLYSRALRPCDDSCPLWANCPCSSDDVKALPPPDRPPCPYERAHYQAALTDARARAPKTYEDNVHPAYLHLCHQIALLQTMMLRAASALRDRPLVDSVSAAANDYAMQSSKPSAYLQAFLRISSEYRSYLKLLQALPLYGLTDSQLQEHDRRTQLDTSLEPEHQAAVETTRPACDARAERFLQKASEYLDKSFLEDALTYFNAAHFLAPHLAEPKRPTFDAAVEAIRRRRGS